MTIPVSSISSYVKPDLAEFISRRMRDISARINAHTIGEIVSFNPVNQTAVINVSFMRVLRGVNPIGDSGNSSDEVISYPQLVDVPVIVLQGGGGRLTFPITAGESCLLLFCDRDMDSWFTAGLTAVPNSNRVHDINDAVCLVGLNNLQNVISDYDGTNVQLKFGSVYITLYATGTASVIDTTGERLVQAGFLQPYAGSAAPSGWLLCYGQSVLRATYPVLFAIIGTTYGAADGTHFSLPDLRGRIPIGLDNMGGSNANVLTNTYTPNRNTLGGNVGEETHTLTVPEIPSHDHSVFFNSTGSTGFGTFEEGAGAPNTTPPSGDSGSFSGQTAHTGGGSPHYNIQPGMMFNWLIKI